MEQNSNYKFNGLSDPWTIVYMFTLMHLHVFSWRVELLQFKSDYSFLDYIVTIFPWYSKTQLIRILYGIYTNKLHIGLDLVNRPRSALRIRFKLISIKQVMINIRHISIRTFIILQWLDNRWKLTFWILFRFKPF